MVEYGEIGSIHMCHFVALLLGYYSLLNPLRVLFFWTGGCAYSFSALLKQMNFSILQSSILLHRRSMAFFTGCLVLAILKFRNSRLFEKSTLYRLSPHFRARRFYEMLFFSASSSFVISTALNGDITNQDFVGLGLLFLFMDWSFFPGLIKVSVTAPMTGYSHFDRENYVKLHADEAAVFFSSMDNVVLDHVMKLLTLNALSHWLPYDMGIVCERLKTHLVVVFISTFTLLPVLVRINFADKPQNAGFFSFQLSHFIAKKTNRSRTETKPAKMPSNSSAFKPIYSRLYHATHFATSIALVFVNAVCAVQLFARRLFSEGFSPRLFENYVNFTNIWMCALSSLILLSFYFTLRHVFALDCTCNLCVTPRPRRSQLRSESENFVEFEQVNTSSKVVASPETPVRESILSNFDGDHTSPEDVKIEKDFELKSPKPACAVKARPSIAVLSDADILRQLRDGRLKSRELETAVGSLVRAVSLRRRDLAARLPDPASIDGLPFAHYDYRPVMGQCCEEVIGYIPIPVGKVGPLLLDGKEHYVPLATTEGCLIASTNRGCRALYLSGGVRTALFRDAMTRAPVVMFPSVAEVVECIGWVESPQNFQILRVAFNETSSHADLISIFPCPAGRYLHLRFAARTGEAMGMNMVSKGTERALRTLGAYFPRMQVVSLSGNLCCDKKSSASNALLGRGKSVLAEARLPARVVARVLRSTPARLARLARAKLGTGSALAGANAAAAGNAHAANLVAALFAATGQDLAQVVDASACMTQLEVEGEADDYVPSASSGGVSGGGGGGGETSGAAVGSSGGEGGSLYVSVTLPCVELGTVGGGTRLPAQRAALGMLDLSLERPAQHLARLLAGVVLAGELSLMAALSTHELVAAHMKLNRAADAVATATADHPGSTEAPNKATNESGNNAVAGAGVVGTEHFAM